jgi:hypothetical protein
MTMKKRTTINSISVKPDRERGAPMREADRGRIADLIEFIPLNFGIATGEKERDAPALLAPFLN